MTKCPACSRDCADHSRFCAWCAAPMDATSAETAVLGSVSAPRLSATSSVDEGRFLPGTVLAGRYRIAGLLGRGGMGEVYRATDLTLGQAISVRWPGGDVPEFDDVLRRNTNPVASRFDRCQRIPCVSILEVMSIDPPDKDVRVDENVHLV